MKESQTLSEIHENTNKIVHLNLPQRPEGDLSEEKLLKIATAGTGAALDTANKFSFC